MTDREIRALAATYLDHTPDRYDRLNLLTAFGLKVQEEIRREAQAAKDEQREALAKVRRNLEQIGKAEGGDVERELAQTVAVLNGARGGMKL
jgi:hypothetical protein